MGGLHPRRDNELQSLRYPYLGYDAQSTNAYVLDNVVFGGMS